jgi:DNA modification methylase
MIKITKEKLALTPGKYEQLALVGDARNFFELPELRELRAKVDCIVTHPPYWKAIPYSKEHGKPLEGDLSLNRTLDDFLANMRQVFCEMYDALQPGGYCCVTIGDIGEGGYLVPLGFHLTKIGLDTGFKMKDIAIWVLSGERSIRSSAYRLRFVEGHNCLMIKHNYVLIFRKPE